VQIYHLYITSIMDPSERVLALSMRPKSLDELVGQDSMVNTIETQFSTNRIPHFYIISGPIGSGKTTLARILALIVQSYAKTKSISDLPWSDYKNYDIKEINAANKNGIEDIRALVDTMRFMPMPPSNAKVVILDEAHQLTVPAQNALLTEVEDVSKYVYYIFCTSQIKKLIPAIQRRAYIITPNLLSNDDVGELLMKAKNKTSFEGDIEPLQDALKMHDVNSPGLVLQAAEKYFAGIPPHECVLCSTSNPKLDTMVVCRSVAKGDWKAASAQLVEMTKSDIVMVRNCVLGYLKTMLLKSTGSKAQTIARAIQDITKIENEETQCLPTFLAGLCIACERLRTSA
jgi:DNA polymerase III delta prime subunit